jgi:hypothetical protein
VREAKPREDGALRTDVNPLFGRRLYTTASRNALVYAEEQERMAE